MWRKRSEGAKDELAGDSKYGKQVPQERAVPMWGGIGRTAFGLVCFHKNKKINSEDWAKVVRLGNLKRACQEACAPQKNGPWVVVCDNESFLDAKDSKKAYKQCNVELMHVPPRSPDLNPVEKYWSWVRRRLRALDLKDLHAKRKPLGKSALQARVRRVLQTRKAKTVASRIFLGFRKTCQECVNKSGRATKG